MTFVLFAFTLSACGFKGPLYLPKPSETSKASQPTAAASAVSK
ncbi:lipoprotein [Deefgea tanakiae]|uniref:Lipoprotein n=1 Tax=Deefgea tanakiae TaxID=2865840 RepID=A0ABX8Z7B8_9NEIS|nr:lipoprotein [Deefgea tanakiae]